VIDDRERSTWANALDVGDAQPARTFDMLDVQFFEKLDGDRF
jgi:hypothetical protein